MFSVASKGGASLSALTPTPGSWPATITGKARRLGRLFDANGRTLMVAVDHSLSRGPFGGVADMRSVLHHAVTGGADAVITHRGAAVRAMPIQRQMGLIIHLSAGPALIKGDQRRELACDPETALSLGADAVSMQVTLGIDSRTDRDALGDLGRVAASCDHLGLPLIVMSYAVASMERRSRGT